jgi:hypothetical protein
MKVGLPSAPGLTAAATEPELCSQFKLLAGVLGFALAVTIRLPPPDCLHGFFRRAGMTAVRGRGVRCA